MVAQLDPTPDATPDDPRPDSETWRERNEREKLTERARRLVFRLKMAQLARMDERERAGIGPQPGDVVTDEAGRQYMVRRDGWRRIK